MTHEREEKSSEVAREVNETMKLRILLQSKLMQKIKLNLKTSLVKEESNETPPTAAKEVLVAEENNEEKVTTHTVEEQTENGEHSLESD